MINQIVVVVHSPLISGRSLELFGKIADHAWEVKSEDSLIDVLDC